MKKTTLIVSAVVFAMGIGSVAYAASNYTVKSNGILRYDGNADGDFTDSEDVVFDSSDLVNINNEVDVLKTGLEGYELQLQTVTSDVEQLKEDMISVNDGLQSIEAYVGSDGKLHFVDASGADTVLPFSGSLQPSVLLQNGNADGGAVKTYAVPSDCNNVVVFTHGYTYNGTPFGLGATSVSSTKGVVSRIFYNASTVTPCFVTCVYIVTDCSGSTLTIYSGGAANVYARYSIGKLS